MMKGISIWLITLLLALAVIAQESCSVFVSDALALLDDICGATGRNELCYGNTLVSVTTISGNDLNFSQPGDIISILDVASIRTSPYAAPDEWGIAHMTMQANIPDSLPGQNVTFLLFGDVNLHAANTDENSAPTLIARTATTINIRSGPSTNYAVIGSLESDTRVNLVGRNSTGDWVFFINEDRSGWLFGSLLDIPADVMILDELTDDFAEEASVAPMQAVYFSSGIGQATCHEVPQDGILIQTPEYGEAIELIVNDVEIRLGSTVYLQAQANRDLKVYILEGLATITANGNTIRVPQGAFTTIPIDADLHAIGIPSEPEAYDLNLVESLPVGALPEIIEIAAPASVVELQQPGCTITTSYNTNLRYGPGTAYPVTGQLSTGEDVEGRAQARGTDNFIWWQLSQNSWVRSDVADASNSCDTLPMITVLPPVPTPVQVPTPSVDGDGANGLPPSGRWQHTGTVIANTCGPDTIPVGTVNTGFTTVTFQADESSLTWDFGFTDTNGHYWLFNAGRIGDNSYAFSAWNGLTGTITFTSPTTYVGTHRGDYAASPGFEACIFYENYEGHFVGG